MGNCFAACRQRKVSCCGAVAFKNQKAVQLVKTDGNIIEFSMPILVKDALLNFSGFGIALARKTTLQLPPNFQLRLGNKYYLIPPPVGSSKTAAAADHSQKVEKDPEKGSVKRIKVIITKQQLQELLSKQVLAKDILSGLYQSKTTCFYSDDDDNSSTCWKPKLESIPEGNEII